MDSDFEISFLKSIPSSFTRLDFWCLGFFQTYTDSYRVDQIDLLTSVGNLARLKVIDANQKVELIKKFIKLFILKDKKSHLPDSDFIFLTLLNDKIETFNNIDPSLFYGIGKKGISDLSILKNANIEIGPRNSFISNKTAILNDILNQALENKKKEDLLAEKRRKEEEQRRLEEEKAQNEQESCVICYGTKENEHIVVLDTCIHSFHQTCLVPYFKVLAQEKKEANCPICKKKLNKNQAIFLKASYVESPQKNINKQNDFIESPILAKKISQELSFKECVCAVCGALNYANVDHFKIICTECQQEFCDNCKVIWHIDMSCSEFKKWGHDGFNECPSCHNQQGKVPGMKSFECTKCHKDFCQECKQKYTYHHKCALLYK